MTQPEATSVAPSTGARYLQHLRRLLPLLFITACPVALTSPLWLEVWHGVRPRATNGSGHFAIAQIYDQAIFPDTFGWVQNYFGGMPFPNFYPPLFYWLVALLHHTQLVSFTNAFKLVMVLPLLLLPAALWLLAWLVANRQRAVANCAAGASLLLLFVPQFQLKTISGLDYYSTLVVGLYTQPLGFVLLLGWYAAYLGAHRQRWRFALASALLALTILANFFNAMTAALFIACVLVRDVWRYHRAPDDATRARVRGSFVAHLASPFVAACLALFWLAPMLGTYSYLVTRPFVIPLGELVSPALVVWYGVACVGLALGLRRTAGALWAYSLACLVLGVSIISSGTLAPSWFPLQSYRFLATLDFLLAVPVGVTVLTCYRALERLARRSDAHRQPSGDDALPELEPRPTNARSTAFILAAATGALLFVGTMTAKAPKHSTLTFYQQEENEQIAGVLRFATQHRDGRYLVELADTQSGYAEAGYDSRALSAYLGLQGNEPLSAIFRESSPNVLFVNPQVNAFSAHPDNHGISSVLADDQDFVAQPLTTHLARARLLGAKYIVVATPAMKARLRNEAEVASTYELGAWSVFELRHDPPAPVRALSYRPALVVSNFSLKGRRRGESGFVRLAEEQFADNWFDVLLARAPDTKLDRLRDLDQFGALVLDAYDYADEELAYAKLRAFAQQRALILLASDAPLYRRIKRAGSEFPLAQFIEREPRGDNSSIEALAPSFRYNASGLRAEWGTIRRALEQHKVSVAPQETNSLTGTFAPTSLSIDIAPHAPERIPVLLNTTYHPNWQRADGQSIYAATPFAMLTFIDRPIRLNYARGLFERFALFASALALLGLSGFACWPLRQRLLLFPRLTRAFRFSRWTTAKKFIGG